MAYLEQPKGYWYWFKQVARMCFPMKHDFYGLGDALWEAVCALSGAMLRITARLVILLTFPVSVPLIAAILKRHNKRVMEIRAKLLSEKWDGFPPQFTKEEVQKVLDGEITLEQLRKEKEDRWNS